MIEHIETRKNMLSTHKSMNTLNAMTVDVEDYFQVSAFDRYVEKEDWPKYESRVERNTDRILALFDQYDTKATFFTLGWVAEKFPSLVQRITEAGHDIASHGWDHVRVTELTQVQFAEDVGRAKKVLEDITGQQIIGYRAPSYSFTKENVWAHPTLLETGYRYSSSVAPIKHRYYGIPDAPRFAHTYADGQVLELPITTTKIFSRNLPCGGGGWFRLYPYAASRWAIKRVNRLDNEAAIFYFHPWEIDPDQPRIKVANAVSMFRHYQNLTRMEGKIERLLVDFRWGSIPDVYAPLLENSHLRYAANQQQPATETEQLAESFNPVKEQKAGLG